MWLVSSDPNFDGHVANAVLYVRRQVANFLQGLGSATHNFASLVTNSRGNLAQALSQLGIPADRFQPTKSRCHPTRERLSGQM